MNIFMKKLVIILLSVFCMGQAYAQLVQVHVGVTTGGNATFVLDKGISEDPRYNSTYTFKPAPVGFNFGVDFGKKFGLSLEGIKARQGQIFEIIDIAQKVRGERRIDLDYFHVPFLLKFMSGGTKGTRANFNIGPQMSFLTNAREYVTASAGTFEIPEGVDFSSIQQEFPDAIDNGDGTYDVPTDVPAQDILSKKANDFKNSEFAIAAAFGLDIDLSKHLFLTTQIRANYSLTDIRNGDVIERIKNGDGGSIFGERANLVVGIQVGIHYMFGKTRSFKYKP